jgi:hypothetical protein
MGKLWVPAGRVRFSVHDSIHNNKKCFLFDGKGKTHANYDWFFKVRDHYASLVEKDDFTPQKFIRNVNEGSFSLYYDYDFNSKDQKANVYQKINGNEKTSTIDFPYCSYDVMASVYYARTLDFDDVNIGDSISLKMMVDKKIYNHIYIIYTGKEIIKDQYGKEYSCIKFRPKLIEGTIFKDGEYMEVYVTDDRNRIPIFIEAEILVGSIKVYIKSIKNNKFAMSSMK